MTARRHVTPLKLAIVKSGRRQKDIAAALGLGEVTLSRIVSGLHCDDATKTAIADELGMQIHELWPEAQAA